MAGAGAGLGLAGLEGLGWAGLGCYGAGAGLGLSWAGLWLGGWLGCGLFGVWAGARALCSGKGWAGPGWAAMAGAGAGLGLSWAGRGWGWAVAFLGSGLRLGLP